MEDLSGFDDFVEKVGKLYFFHVRYIFLNHWIYSLTSLSEKTWNRLSARFSVFRLLTYYGPVHKNLTAAAAPSSTFNSVIEEKWLSLGRRVHGRNRSSDSPTSNRGPRSRTIKLLCALLKMSLFVLFLIDTICISSDTWSILDDTEQASVLIGGTFVRHLWQANSHEQVWN
jgi:hypothetical protein